jgi:hypothetical protein
MAQKSTNINISLETKAKLNDVIMHLVSLNKTTKKSFNHAINFMCDQFLKDLKKELEQARNEEKTSEETSNE